MKKVNFELLSMSVLTLSFLVSRVDASETKIGVVDYNRVLNGVDEGKSAKEKLQKEKEKNDKDLADRKAKLEKMKTELQDLDTKMRSNLLNEAEQKRAQKLEQDFNKLLAESAQLSQKYNEQIFGKETSETQEILRKIQPLTEDLARAGNFDQVFEKKESGLVYAKEATDLTEKVIQKYNSQYKPQKSKP